MIEWEFGLCTFTERTSDGFIRLAPDWYGEQQASGPPLESVSPFGLLSRPRDPDVDPAGTPTRGAGLLYLEHGGLSFAIPVQDPRFATALPALKKGSTLLYATLGSGAVATVLLDGEDGSLTITTPAGERLKVTDTEVVIGSSSAARALVQEEALQAYFMALNTAIAAGCSTQAYTAPPAPQFGTIRLRAE